MNQRDFERQGETIHQRLIEEVFKKDKNMQAQFREQFTTQPAAFHEQMERIEAGAKGFTMQDGVAINNKTEASQWGREQTHSRRYGQSHDAPKPRP